MPCGVTNIKTTRKGKVSDDGKAHTTQKDQGLADAAEYRLCRTRLEVGQSV